MPSQWASRAAGGLLVFLTLVALGLGVMVLRLDRRLALAEWHLDQVALAVHHFGWLETAQLQAQGAPVREEEALLKQMQSIFGKATPPSR